MQWLELLKDYNLEIKYNLGKANVVDDALSRKPKGVVALLLTTNQNLSRELDALGIEVIPLTDPSQLVALQVTSPVVDRIIERQTEDPKLMKLSKKVKEGKGQEFSLTNGVLCFRDHLCVPNIPELKELLKEAHDSTLVTHPRSTKTYQDFKRHYWWIGMKRDAANYVARCLTC